MRNGLFRRVAGLVSLVYAGCLGTIVACRSVRHMRALPVPHRTLHRTLLGTYVGGSCTGETPVRVQIASDSLRVLGMKALPSG